MTAVQQPPRRTEGLSTTADDRAVPSARRRLAPAAAATRTGSWAGSATVAVTLLAGFLRLWQLGRPHAFLFDETYYAKDAWSLWHHGYVTGYVDEANEKILAGHLDGPLDRLAEHGRAPRGREVADRAGRAPVRHGPVRLAHRLGASSGR